MGLRHLQGLDGVADWIDVVDPRAAARDSATAACSTSSVSVHGSLEDVIGLHRFDAAIVASTASGRLETVDAILNKEVPAILLEKPLDQSRQRVRKMIERARSSRSTVWINHYRRALSGYEPLRGKGPLFIAISSGAIGLGANGIHWIDFALHLTGVKSGELLFGEIGDVEIASGRGPQFRDYGGCGVFGFPDGSRLMLACRADSSAPTMMSIVSATSHWVVDQHLDITHRHARRADVNHPTYLCGRDYQSETARGLEAANLPALTRSWVEAVGAGREPQQPRVGEVEASYELLFDLLETSGRSFFHFT